MKRSEEQSLSLRREKITLAGLLGFALLMAASAIGQDYRTLSGASDRAGRATAQPAIGVAETVWNNPGRGFLRWWDPIFEVGAELDNDQFLTSFTGTWIDPAPFGLANPNIELAVPYFELDFTDPPYRVGVTSPTTATLDDPAAGATGAYQWIIDGLVAGEAYSIEVNIPIGLTNIQPDGNLPADIRSNAQYFGYRVTDANGQRVYWIDTFRDGGGLVELDEDIFIPTAGGQITVELFNTVLGDDFGSPIGNFDSPGESVVYADYVQAIGRSRAGVGSYTASPVVGQLVSTRPNGGATVFDQRVVSALNETSVIGALNKTFNVGVVTSFTHNGEVVDALEPLRRNMVWSWPAVRPFNLTDAEDERYVTDRQSWVLGAPNANYPRYEVFRQLDNLSPGTSNSGPFVSAATWTRRGPDYYLAPAALSATGNVTWTSSMEEGFFFVEVFLPTDDLASDLATTVRYEVLAGATVISTVTLNQSALGGWVRLPFQPTEGWENTEAAPLAVRVTNVGSAQDVADNRSVYADAVRFVGDADLAIDSTPVLVSATVNNGSTTQPRDVVVAARENGRIYVMDAHGNETTGAQEDVYWVWPSENPATDPNEASTEDYGIATQPTKFDLSSAFVENVNGEDLLFIASTNGKVYCLEMEGRGDGTTRRRWTYPDDFNPSSPLTPMTASTLGPIKGSLALADVGGTPAVIVPASTGRIVALDAAGNAATRTTSVLWEYPPAASPSLGDISMSPVVAFGNVYFASADLGDPENGVMHAVNEDTGLASWTRTFRADGSTPFGTFGRATPTAIPGSLLPNLAGTPDIVVFADTGDFGGNLTAVNAATGAVVWEELEATSEAINSALTFTHMRQFDSGGLFLDAIPTVVVATIEGRLEGFKADGTLNLGGTRSHWNYFLQGDSQVASFATGGWPNTLLHNRSHLYIGDSEGLLYAFSSINDDGGGGYITPGLPPGGQTADDDDPDEAALNGMIDPDDVILISPDQYRNLQNRSRDGGITMADITDIKTRAVTRRTFEMGESIYVAVVDIHKTTEPSTANYFIEVDIDARGNDTRPQAAAVRDITDNPSDTEGGVAFVQIQLRPDGARGIRPGGVSVEARARIGGSRNIRGDEVDLAVSAVTPSPAGDIFLANPFGVRMPNNSQAGVNVLSNDPSVAGNAPLGYVGGVNVPRENWTTEFGATTSGAPDLPGQRLSTATNALDPVQHGTDGVTQVEIYDRSLSFLVLGDGRTPSGVIVGMQSVRWRPSDLAWQPITNPDVLGADGTSPAYPKLFDPSGDLGVVKPLNTGSNKANWAYANFEDYPLFYPNRSLDYPDLTRGGLQVTKAELGNAENPIFDTGVSLTPPAFLPADLTSYLNDRDVYNTGFPKTDQPTPMNVRWAVPRYQPATLITGGVRAGYASRQTIYVDSGNPGFDTSEPYRQFVLAADVAPDVRLSSGTPTVDLGSTPAGGGWNGGTTFNAGPNQYFGPAQPWTPASGFKPANPNFTAGNNPQFQQFSVLNDGNTNLLNLRVAKQFGIKGGSGATVSRPVDIFAPGLHELAWMDAGWNVVSDLDPGVVPAEIFGLPNEYSWMKLQKSRPGDVAPTRLVTNPAIRSNANLAVSGGYLLPPGTFNPTDPYIGIAPPIGTPVGSYERRVFVFEDEQVETGLPPVLGPTNVLLGDPSIEAYTDPGFVLKFNVRESRLTNRPTTKASPNTNMLLPNGNERFAWANAQPSALRTTAGDLFVAWASNRLNNGGTPDYAASVLRGEGTMFARDVWRIYLSSLTGEQPNVVNPALFGGGPSRDLNAWTANNPETWFNPGTQIPAVGTEASLFPAVPGQTIVAPNAAAYKFYAPSFPTGGAANYADPNPERSSLPNTAMAFLGDVPVVDAGGQRSTRTQLLMADLAMSAAGAVTVNGYSAMPYDLLSQKSRPSVTRLQNGGDRYTVYYTSYNNGPGELYVTTFSPGAAQPWTAPVSLNVGQAFDDISAPSAVLRRYQNANPMANLFFTGKLRGAQNSETFMGQVALDATGQPTGRNPFATFEDRNEMLRFDARSGSYQSSGIYWSLDDSDLQNLIVRVRGAFNNNQYRTLGTGADAGVVVDAESGQITMDSRLGGKIYIDTIRGTVRLSGVALPRNSDVFVQCSPRLLRVSGATSKQVVQRRTDPDDPNSPLEQHLVTVGNSTGANYRGVSAVFDDRYIGVNYFGPGDPRNLLEDQNYWFQAGTNIAAFTANNQLPIRHDRLTVVANRTSNDGAAATRPFLSTMRIGVELPAPVATNQNGNLLVMSVTPSVATPNAWYQVDPANGRIYVSAELEGVPIRIAYQSATQTGSPGPTYDFTAVPTPIFERGETAVPIEQVGSDSDLSLTVDPFTNIDVTARRAPLLWMFWTSTRSGVPDVFFQTIAPKTAPQGPAN